VKKPEKVEREIDEENKNRDYRWINFWT